MAAAAQRSFRHEAESFRSYCHRQFGADLDYSFDSLALLDGVLDECYQGLKSMNETEGWTFLNNISLAAGSYLGEVLARQCNGHWEPGPEPGHLQNWYVTIPARAGPPRQMPVFKAVYDFLERGPTETLLAFVAPLLTADGEWPHATTAPRTPRSAKPHPAHRRH